MAPEEVSGLREKIREQQDLGAATVLEMDLVTRMTTGALAPKGSAAGTAATMAGTAALVADEAEAMTEEVAGLEAVVGEVMTMEEVADLEVVVVEATTMEEVADSEVVGEVTTMEEVAVSEVVVEAMTMGEVADSEVVAGEVTTMGEVADLEVVVGEVTTMGEVADLVAVAVEATTKVEAGALEVVAVEVGMKMAVEEDSVAVAVEVMGTTAGTEAAAGVATMTAKVSGFQLLRRPRINSRLFWVNATAYHFASLSPFCTFDHELKLEIIDPFRVASCWITFLKHLLWCFRETSTAAVRAPRTGERGNPLRLWDQCRYQFRQVRQDRCESKWRFCSSLESATYVALMDLCLSQMSGSNAPEPISSFESAGLRDFILQNVKRSGYTKPTPVQKYALPCIMAGRDLMACAQTGSGKTVSVLMSLDPRSNLCESTG